MLRPLTRAISMATAVTSHHPPEPMLHDSLLTAGEVNPAAVLTPEMTAPAPVPPPTEPTRSPDPAVPTDAATETVPAPDPAPDDDSVLRLLKGKLADGKINLEEFALMVRVHREGLKLASEETRRLSCSCSDEMAGTGDGEEAGPAVVDADAGAGAEAAPVADVDADAVSDDGSLSRLRSPCLADSDADCPPVEVEVPEPEPEPVFVAGQEEVSGVASSGPPQRKTSVLGELVTLDDLPAFRSRMVLRGRDSVANTDAAPVPPRIENVDGRRASSAPPLDAAMRSLSGPSLAANDNHRDAAAASAAAAAAALTTAQDQRTRSSSWTQGSGSGSGSTDPDATDDSSDPPIARQASCHSPTAPSSPKPRGLVSGTFPGIVRYSRRQPPAGSRHRRHLSDQGPLIPTSRMPSRQCDPLIPTTRMPSRQFEEERSASSTSLIPHGGTADDNPSLHTVSSPSSPSSRAWRRTGTGTAERPKSLLTEELMSQSLSSHELKKLQYKKHRRHRSYGSLEELSQVVLDLPVKPPSISHMDLAKPPSPPQPADGVAKEYQRYQEARRSLQPPERLSHRGDSCPTHPPAMSP